MKRILCILLFGMSVFATYSQVFQTYYNDGPISIRVEQADKIVDYKTRRVQEVRIYNSSANVYEITGYVRVRFTELRTGKTDSKDCRFNMRVSNSNYGKYVNTYFKPSWSIYGGWTDQVSFYIESCRPLDSSQLYSNQNVNIPKTYFRQKSTFYGEDASSKMEVTYYPNGTCKCTGYVLENDHWVKGTSDGVYYMQGNVIYVMWDEWLKENYTVNNSQYVNGGLILRLR